MMLGGELTLRETVHQVEAFRRIDEATLRLVGRNRPTADYRRATEGVCLTRDTIERITDRRHPQRVDALNSWPVTRHMISADIALRSILSEPHRPLNCLEARDLREMVDLTVGTFASAPALRREIVVRRAAFHPDYQHNLPQTGSWAPACCEVSYSFYDALAQMAERPDVQRALFPRGERWAGTYSVQAAMRDVENVGPVLGYLAVMTVIAAFRFLGLMAQSMASDISRACVWAGLQMPNQGAGYPQMLALPVA